MPRKKRLMPTVRWSIHVPMDLAGVVEEHFMNATLRKPDYGARQNLIVNLLQKWATEQRIFSQAPKEII